MNVLTRYLVFYEHNSYPVRSTYYDPDLGSIMAQLFRSDRDMYVDIRWNNIAEGRSDQFQTYRLLSV